MAQKPYTAGEIQSKESVKFGRFEMLMYSSDHSGTTSTFFMWKDGGQTATSRWNEIDIETFGKDESRWQSNPIWQYDDSDQVIKRWEGFHSQYQIANAWVKFTLEWTPNYIAWFANDLEVRRIVKGQDGGDGLDPVGYITDPMRMAFNHWSAFSVPWLGEFYPDNLPSYQFVDWLTYQKWNGSGFDPVSIRQDFNDKSEVTRDYHISSHTFDDNRCDFSPKAIGVTNGYLWLGIFKAGEERIPNAEIPNIPKEYLHAIPGKIEAEEYTTQTGLQKETVVATEGVGENIGYTDSGDFAEYTIDVSSNGNYEIEFRVASLNGDAGLKLLIDNQTLIKDLVIDKTNGWQTWETIKQTIALPAGKHTLRFEVLRAGFNLNWMKLTSVVTSGSINIDAKNSMYPNPVNNTLYLSNISQWKILSPTGIVLKQGKSKEIDMHQFESGIYFIKTSNGTNKIIKE